MGDLVIGERLGWFWLSFGGGEAWEASHDDDASRPGAAFTGPAKMTFGESAKYHYLLQDEGLVRDEIQRFLGQIALGAWGGRRVRYRVFPVPDTVTTAPPNENRLEAITWAENLDNNAEYQELIRNAVITGITGDDDEGFSVPETGDYFIAVSFWPVDLQDSPLYFGSMNDWTFADRIRFQQAFYDGYGWGGIGIGRVGAGAVVSPATPTDLWYRRTRSRVSFTAPLPIPPLNAIDEYAKITTKVFEGFPADFVQTALVGAVDNDFTIGNEVWGGTYTIILYLRADDSPGIFDPNRDRITFTNYLQLHDQPLHPRIGRNIHARFRNPPVADVPVAAGRETIFETADVADAMVTDFIREIVAGDANKTIVISMRDDITRANGSHCG